MPSKEYNLGETEHIYLRSSLKLTTRCSIKLSSPYALTFPFSSIFQKLDSLTSSGSWIDRGHGLQISFRLLIGALYFHDMERTAFLDGLGAVLCNSEIWTQLGLKACLILPQNARRCGLPSDDLVLSLCYHEFMGNAATRFEINESPPALSIRPPQGVPLVFVEHIYFNFTFSYLQKHASIRPRKVASFNDLCADMLFNFVDSPHEDHPTPHGFPSNLLNSDRVQSPSFNRNSTQLVGKRISDPSSSLFREYPFRASKTDSFVRSSFEDSSPDTKFQPEELGQVSGTDGIVFADSIKLVDAGLRSTLSKHEAQLSKGIMATIESKEPKLAEISPALFSPGYLQMFAEHNQYSNTIAHTISMIYRHTRSPILQSKMARLMSFSPDEHVQDERPDSENPQNRSEPLLKAVKVRLWRLVQSKLVGRAGVERLKSINGANKLISRSLHGQEMLEHENSPKALLFERTAELQAPGGEEAMLEVMGTDGSLLNREDKTPDNHLYEEENLFSEGPMTYPPFCGNISMHNYSAEEDLFSGEQSTGNFNEVVWSEASILEDDDHGEDVELLDCWI